MDVRVGLWRKLSAGKLMLLNCGVGENSWESLGLLGDPTSPSYRRSVLGVHWKDWCWSWNANTLATSCEELTHWKRPWCSEGLGAGGEGDDRGWDGWMASPTRWAWVWVNSGSWWQTGRPGVLRLWGRKESDTTERLNWTESSFGYTTSSNPYNLWSATITILQLGKKKKNYFCKTWQDSLNQRWTRLELHPGLLPISSTLLLSFSCSVVSDSLQPHGLQHARLPCPSPSPRVCSNSCPVNGWCHPMWMSRRVTLFRWSMDNSR